MEEEKETIKTPPQPELSEEKGTPGETDYVPSVQEPGEDQKPPLGVNDEDFKPHTESGEDLNIMPEKAEQTVDKLGRPAGFNQFYHGDHAVNPENPLLEHLDSTDYDNNKNRGNR